MAFSGSKPLVICNLHIVQAVLLLRGFCLRAGVDGVWFIAFGPCGWFMVYTDLLKLYV